MIKKTVKYEDFNGNQKETTCYFHLSKPELLELEYSKKGGFTEWINRLAESQDRKEIFNTVKNFVLSSYGEKSVDGDTFDKSDDIKHKFERSAIYDSLMMELCTSETAIVDFMYGILPADMQQAAKAEYAKLKGGNAN